MSCKDQMIKQTAVHPFSAKERNKLLTHTRSMNLKDIKLGGGAAERETVSKGYILYESLYRTFWRQNHGMENKTVASMG